MSSRKRERTLAVGEFKAECLAVLDEVEAHGCSVVITKRGRPVARVVPLTRAGSSLRGSLLHEDDLLSPVDTHARRRRGTHPG